MENPEKTDSLERSLQKLFESQLQIECVKSENNVLKQENQALRKKLNEAYHDNEKESETQRNIIQMKNDEILNLEVVTKSQREKINSLQEEVLSLKSCSLNFTDNAQDNQHKEIKTTARTPTHRESRQDIPQKKPTPQKPNVIIIGTSNIENIKPDIISSKVNASKIISYTLDDTLKVVNEMNPTLSPSAIVLHSLTNSIKERSADYCVNKLGEVISLIQEME